MMKTFFAAISILLLTTGAQAYCVSIPDNANSDYVRNGLKKTICLADELADTTAAANQRVGVESALKSLELQLQQERLKAIQPPVFVPPTFTTPSPFLPTFP